MMLINIYTVHAMSQKLLEASMYCSVSFNPHGSTIIPMSQMRKLGAQRGEVTCPESHEQPESSSEGAWE